MLVFYGRWNLRTMKLEYLAEEISKQSIEDAAKVLLMAYSKMQEEKMD